MRDRWHPQRRLMVLAAALGSFWIGQSGAQEPLYMESATQPGRGQTYARLLLYGGSGTLAENGIDHYAAKLKLAHGLRHDLAVLLDVDAVSTHSLAGELDDDGLESWTLRLKYRFLKHDFGPLDTWRASLLAGAEFPGDHDSHAPDRPAARLGLATTAILGRHGLNGQIDWTGRVEDPDCLALNASHLYRLHPARYAAHTVGAWYSMLESLNHIGEAGQRRAELAVGILYEARRWAWELAIRLPVYQDDGYRRHYELATGLRYLF